MHSSPCPAAFEDVWLTTADGLRLHAWLVWPPHWGPEERRRRPTVLFYQENAGNMAFRRARVGHAVRMACLFEALRLLLVLTASRSPIGFPALLQAALPQAPDSRPGLLRLHPFLSRLRPQRGLPLGAGKHWAECG